MNLTFRDLLRPIFRRKFVVIITILVIVTGVYWGLKFRTPVYEARVLIHIKGVGQTVGETIRGIGYFRVHFTQMSIVKSTPVLKPVVLALGLYKRPLDYEKEFCDPYKKKFLEFSLREQKEHISTLKRKSKKQFLVWLALENLKKNVQTQIRPHTDIFEIIVSDYSAEEAVRIANVVSRSYIVFDLKQQLIELKNKYGNLHPSVMQLRSDIRRMTRTLSNKKLSEIEAIGTASVRIIEQATTNYKPVGKSKSLILIISLFVSIFVGIATAIGLDLLNQTIKLPEDIKKFLNIPVIGWILKKRFFDKPLIKDSKRKTRYFEFYEEISMQLNILLEKNKLKIIMFASAMTSNKNSTIIANLGYILSNQFNKKTLIVDANMEKSSMHEVLKLENSPGFSDLLDKNSTRSLMDVVQKLDTNLHFLPSGNNHSGSIPMIQKSPILRSVLGSVKDDYDVALLSSSNIKQFKNILTLASQVDGVIILLDEGKERICTMQKTVEQLKQNQIKLIGGIMNNKVFAIPKLLYDRI